MSPFPVAMKLCRPLLLVILTLVVPVGAGASPPAVPAPHPDAGFQALLTPAADCTSPASDLSGLLGIPEAQPKAASTTCGFTCGSTTCRGIPIGSSCTDIHGNPGTCYGLPQGRQCIDELPLCYCIAD